MCDFKSFKRYPPDYQGKLLRTKYVFRNRQQRSVVSKRKRQGHIPCSYQKLSISRVLENRLSTTRPDR